MIPKQRTITHSKLKQKDQTLTHGLQFPTKEPQQGKLDNLQLPRITFFLLPNQSIWDTNL